MTSTARIEANRRNAQKSTGPRTAEGKARSAQNALQHGLAAEAAVLPQEDAGEFEAAQGRWVADLRPADEAERTLVERAALASWRLRRCVRSETARLAHRARHAANAFERAQQARAFELGNRVVADPLFRHGTILDAEARKKAEVWFREEPAVLVAELESFSQGVDWLLARWRDLARVLSNDGFWHFPEKFSAIRLLGRRAEDLLHDETVGKVMLACHVLHPEPWDFWNELVQACIGRVDRPCYYRQSDLLLARKPESPADAMTVLATLVVAEVRRLEALKAESLDPLNELDRAEAADRAALDDSKEGVLARRYETACERELHRSLGDLFKRRKDEGREAAPPAESEPVAAEPTPGPESVAPEGEPDSTARNEPKPKGRPRSRRGVRAQKTPRCGVEASPAGDP